MKGARISAIWRRGVLSLTACVVFAAAVAGCAVRHGAAAERAAQLAENPLLAIAAWCEPGGDAPGLPSEPHLGDGAGVCSGAGHGGALTPSSFDFVVVAYGAREANALTGDRTFRASRFLAGAIPRAPPLADIV